MRLVSVALFWHSVYLKLSYQLMLIRYIQLLSFVVSMCLKLWFHFSFVGEESHARNKVTVTHQ